MEERTIAIIGGGAAGLTAAITAARAGAGVTILEHMDRVGKKILSTGNGRCNYTNAALSPSFYYSGNPGAVGEILRRYPTERILLFFEELGIVPWQRDGYYYPASGQASAMLDCLRDECERLGVEICCDTKVISVAAAEAGGRGRNHFTVNSTGGSRKFDRVILACGGQAAPFTGSDGSGYELAGKMGHRIRTPFPALTGLKADPKRFKNLAGIRVRAAASLYTEGRLAAEDSGELQLTENGLSGIVIFQLSHLAVRSFLDRKRTEIHINFLPETVDRDVFGFLKQRQKRLGYKELKDWGVGLFHKKLWLELIKEAGLSPSVRAEELDNRALGQLKTVITDFNVPIMGYLGYDRAQVTAGGVDMRDIFPETLESRRTPGLYLAGELLDVDGICGGYNLHWAWASGMLAGESAGRNGCRPAAR